MSGLVKSIKKTFKKITKGVKKVLSSKVFQAVIVAAAIYFTVGAATAYFAAPAAGAGGVAGATTTVAGATTAASSVTPLAAKASYMAAVEASAASATAANATAAAAKANFMLDAGNSVAAGNFTATEAVAQTIGQSAAELEAATAFANTSYAGEVSAATYTGSAGTAGEVSSGLGAAFQTPAPLDLTIGGAYQGGSAIGETVIGAAGTGGGGGMMAWLEANPMATMILGQAASGAAQGYSAEKAAEHQADEMAKARQDEKDRLANRGLGGYSSTGEWAGSGPRPQRTPRQGVVSSQQVGEPTPAPVNQVATPQVAVPTVAPPQQSAPTQTPVPKDQLPSLLEQGRLA
jgi:hypothetical protein